MRSSPASDVTMGLPQQPRLRPTAPPKTQVQPLLPQPTSTQQAQQPPVTSTASLPVPQQPMESVTGKADGYSRGIEKFVQAAAPRPQMLVGPRSCRQLVVLSCAFGAALVRVAFNENDQPYLLLPGAGTWEWVLGPEECLMVTTTIDTFVTGSVRDLRG